MAGGGSFQEKKVLPCSHEETKNSISDNDIYCMAEDREGNLWIGTISD
jgi:hypothetical protein